MNWTSIQWKRSYRMRKENKIPIIRVPTQQYGRSSTFSDGVVRVK